MPLKKNKKTPGVFCLKNSTFLQECQLTIQFYPRLTPNHTLAEHSLKKPLAINFFALLIDPATIDNITSSMANSWIGQRVTLLCKADGVPMPTLSWYKPDGTMINEVKANESTAVLTMNTEHDFGLYNCTADNGFPFASKMIQVKKISKKNVNKIKTKTVIVIVTGILKVTNEFTTKRKYFSVNKYYPLSLLT